jgi:Putative adhesin
MRSTLLARPPAVLLVLPLLLVTSTGCDVITADLKHSERAEWRRSYEVSAPGRVEISNVNGKIDVEPSNGSSIEVVAVKIARGATPERAKEALGRAEIVEDATRESVRLTTKFQRETSWLHGGGLVVEYTVKVPAGAEVKFTTVNGGVNLTGLSGRITAETTNGGIVARNVGGAIDATTTNGGVDVELTRVADGGARLGCTNGGIKLRLPQDARASISASVTNGGIDTSGLTLETSESSRRRLEGRLNGGGPPIRLEGTNGGITISAARVSER